MSWKHNRGRVKTKAPSNIAWIKYWGKKGLQLPINPSLSMTLDKCHTVTELGFELGSMGDSLTCEFYFHGEKNEKFLPKINTFIDRVRGIYPFLNSANFLEIRSENSFPHSSGIASSASAFCALALALEEIQSKLDGEERDLQRAGQAARLGSGSACRSLSGGFNLWGDLAGELGSDEFAIEMEDVHPVFKSAKNAIFVVNSGEKSVGSTLGHSLMQGHPFARARIEQANKNCVKALSCLRDGDVWELGKIVENEAMSLHALMMTSDPSFILMAPETLELIEMIRTFRESQNIPVFFTLDAGPNPHVLYFEKDKEPVENILFQTMIGRCEKGRVIMDEVGAGAKVLESRFGDSY